MSRRYTEVRSVQSTDTVESDKIIKALKEINLRKFSIVCGI